MKYSRPGGMSHNERQATVKRLGGARLPNASGATQEAPAILAGSEPSKELKQPELTPEEIAATAEANRQARAAQAAQPDPVNGAVDPLDAPPAVGDTLLD